MGEEQDSLPIPGPSPFPAPPPAQGFTCSEFSGYSCRTARAPWTCNRHTAVFQIPHGVRTQALLPSLVTRYLLSSHYVQGILFSGLGNSHGQKRQPPNFCSSHFSGQGS